MSQVLKKCKIYPAAIDNYRGCGIWHIPVAPVKKDRQGSRRSKTGKPGKEIEFPVSNFLFFQVRKMSHK
jgi:hypothetical protein